MIHTTAYYVIKSARPRQWIKNFALYASLVFSGFFFYVPQEGPSYFISVTYAFFIFSILTSSVYILNDIFDYAADRKHPFKKNRPIASGLLNRKTALLLAGLGLLTVFFLSSTLSFFFQLLILAYFLLQLLYAKVLKHIPILDVVSIATGFLIRIYAGSVVVNLHMSVWFLLTVVSASLFLAVGKRQSERTLLMANAGEPIGETRVTLKRYSQRLLDQYTGMFANATWLTYAIFTFQHEINTPEVRFASFFTLLPKTLHSQKLLMLSIPFVIIGVMRYLQLVYESNQGESPEKILLRDKPLLIITFLFAITVMVTTYALS